VAKVQGNACDGSVMVIGVWVLGCMGTHILIVFEIHFLTKKEGHTMFNLSAVIKHKFNNPDVKEPSKFAEKFAVDDNSGAFVMKADAMNDRFDNSYSTKKEASSYVADGTWTDDAEEKEKEQDRQPDPEHLQYPYGEYRSMIESLTVFDNDGRMIKPFTKKEM
jgi:hypothetical protein